MQKSLYWNNTVGWEHHDKNIIKNLPSTFHIHCIVLSALVTTILSFSYTAGLRAKKDKQSVMLEQDKKNK